MTRAGSESDDLPIVDAAVLDDIDDYERRLLDEPGDLPEWNRRFILGAYRSLRAGNVLDLLGLPPNASTTEVKRAYFTLSKQFHPDRYYGKNLGSFGPLLDRLFDAASQAVRILSDRRTRLVPASDAAGKRVLHRLAHRHAADLESGMWPELVRAETLNISRGGVFIRSDATVQPGMELRLHLPGTGGHPIKASGTVAWWRSPMDAAAEGRHAGFGVEFDAASRNRAGFIQLVNFAEARLLAVLPGAAPSDRRQTRSAEPILAVDVGTTNTSMAVCFEDGVRVVPWSGGHFAVPTVFAFDRDGELDFGVSAYAMAVRNPSRVLLSMKRLFGRKADEREVHGILRDSAADLVAGPDGYVCLRVSRQTYSIVQLYGEVLRRARDEAERHLGKRISRVVLTTPVTFDPEHRVLLKRAARIASLDVVDFIDEPTAAVLANRRAISDCEVCGVFDLGGGTFDFSVVEIRGGRVHVLATAGDSWLGGDDFDTALADAVADLTWRQRRLEIRDRQVEYQRLLRAAERTKRELSERSESVLVVEKLLRSKDGVSNLEVTVRRPAAYGLWEPLLRRCIDTARQAMAVCGRGPGELDRLFLSGGSSQMPCVQAAARQLCDQVVIGAALQYAASLGAGVHAGELEVGVPELSLIR